MSSRPHTKPARYFVPAFNRLAGRFLLRSSYGCRNILCMGRRLIDLDAQLDTLLADLARAGATGADESTVDAIVAAIDVCEDKQRRQGVYLARKAKESQAIAELVASGMDEIAATAQVTGRCADAVTRERFIAQARGAGYTGAGFDALVTEMHRDLVTQAHEQAMRDCHGYMVRGDKSDNGYHLWFASDDAINKRATDELISWFETHGRLTRKQLRAHALDGRPIKSTFQATR